MLSDMCVGSWCVCCAWQLEHHAPLSRPVTLQEFEMLMYALLWEQLQHGELTACQPGPVEHSGPGCALCCRVS